MTAEPTHRPADEGAHTPDERFDARHPRAVEPVASSRERRARWEQHYARRLVVTDVVVVALAVLVAHLVRFGGTPSLEGTRGLEVTVSVAVALLWIGWLAADRTRDPRIVGTGVEEYRRVAGATLRLFGTVAILALVLRLDPARIYLAIALPLGGVGLLLGRNVWRRVLAHRRAQGECSATVLVVGSHRSAVELTRCFERDPGAGYRVVGVCIPGQPHVVGETVTVEHHVIPVLGSENDVRQALATCRADTVAVTGADQIGHAGMRALAWELQELEIDLVVAPGVVDVAGPRLTLRPVAGLPLLHVEEPQYEGASRWVKIAFDRTSSALALLVLSPVLLLAALAVAVTSRGPVLYRAERVGLDGHSFSMLKLRTMIDGADQQRDHLAAAGAGNEVLFKMRDDPRVTRVGKVLRKYSIDELPQLWNVLRGEMSVVGPRPPLRSEVETYTGDVHRRLLVKPGVTGLWQVSGRSDLSWDESVRLDLTYVENWSMVGDLLIIWRTLHAVVRGTGAY